MKAQISLSPSPANSCISDFPGKGTLPVLRSLAAQGGSERGCHISSVRQEAEKSRSSPELSSPCQAFRAVQHQVMAWEETQQLHPGDTERSKELEMQGLWSQGIIGNSSFLLTKWGRVLSFHTLLFGWWPSCFNYPRLSSVQIPVLLCNSFFSRLWSVSQDFHHSRKTKHLAEQVPLFVNLFTLWNRSHPRMFPAFKSCSDPSYKSFCIWGHPNEHHSPTKGGGNWSQAVTHWAATKNPGI